jgi:hypothetical protein
MSDPVTKHVVNVGVNALAREVGLSPQAISKKLLAGKTPDQIRQEAEQRRGTAPGKKSAPSKKPSTAPGRPPSTPAEYDLIREGRERIGALDDAKLRRAKALAERSEIENALRRGELIPVAYVRTWGSRFLTDARDTLMTGPSELADTLAAETDPLKTAAIMRAWLERVMGKFHQMERLWGGAVEDEQVA